ncbi:MAG: hypothetical protein M3552_23045, partial [Planctomycetota bacterium]|nr:hypothetical protein [Planctomycetota bacterium]
MSRIAACLLTLLSLAPAFAVDDSDLIRRQSDQRQARAMAQQLVSSVLDMQLRQLEENGLVDLPVYADIRAMRGNLAALVDREMAVVVQRLVEAQGATGAERDAKFVEARRAIREVVIRLSVERQALMRRLKAAEIAEQARRLLEMQNTSREAAVGLAALPENRRAEAALRTIEDQRDVKGVFGRLLETLVDVKTWDGDIATAASEGLRMLKDAGTEGRLDEAQKALAAATFDEAVTHQDAVIEALKKLLAIVERTQDAASDRGELIETVRRLKEEQQTLHDDIQENGLSEPPKPETVEAQQKIAQTLDELTDRLRGDVAALPLREQAATAAKAATEALFTADEARTLAEQQRAVDRLAALEGVLSRSQETRSDRSAAELADAARELEATREELKQAVAKHNEAARLGAAKPQEASDAEKAAAEIATKLRDDQELPATVSSRIADAAEAAQVASKTLAAATGDDAAKRQAASEVAEAGRAFQRAQAAVEEALADTKRAEAAVRIGELARAAEALERAAAAERELGVQAATAAKAEGLSAERVAEMKRVQDDVTGVAAKAAEGVKAAAPDVAATLAKAADAAKRTDFALTQAASAPGEASKNSAGEAAEAARETATELTNAAASLRSRIGEAATQLADLAGEQLQPVAAAQQAVQAAAEASDNPQQASDAAAK